jgi:predicted RNA binding protein YcfA (HicA-like mRNA interferase family)
MAQNPLRNLSSDVIIAFLTDHGFYHAGGDNDAIYVHPNRRNQGVKVTLDRKDTPIGTLYNIIRWSGIPRKTWVEWFSKQRNLR